MPQISAAEATVNVLADLETGIIEPPMHNPNGAAAVMSPELGERLREGGGTRNLLRRRPYDQGIVTPVRATPRNLRDARNGFVPDLGSRPGDIDQRGFVRVFTVADDMGVWVSPDSLGGAGWER